MGWLVDWLVSWFWAVVGIVYELKLRIGKDRDIIRIAKGARGSIANGKQWYDRVMKRCCVCGY